MPRKPRFGCLVVILAVVALIAVIVLWRREHGVPALAGKAADGTTPASIQSSRTRIDAPPAKAGTPYAQRFATWTEKFLNTPAAERPADLMSQGTELVRDRRAEMAELIKKDPRAALEAAVPMAVRQKLPQAIQDQLEERVSGKGFYGVLIATDFEKGTREVRREVVMNDQTYHAYVYGRRLAQVTQERVPLWGVAVPNPANPDGPKP